MIFTLSENYLLSNPKNFYFVQIYTEGYILDNNSNSSQLMAYHLFILLAEAYTNAISDNVRRSFEQMRKEGKYGHYAPVGYLNIKDDNGKSTIVPDPDRVFLITKIFNEYAKGIYTLEEITEKAREWGFSTKTSRKILSIAITPNWQGLQGNPRTA